MNTQSPVGVLSQMHEEENTTKQSPGSRYRESSIGLKKKRSLPNREELRETGWSDRGIIPLSLREKRLVPSRDCNFSSKRLRDWLLETCG